MFVPSSIYAFVDKEKSESYTEKREKDRGIFGWIEQKNRIYGLWQGS
jgi:hypothetical protein